MAKNPRHLALTFTHLRINHEKQGVRPLEGFGVALERARSNSGIGFARFLEDARSTFQIANKRKTGIKPLIPLSEGISEKLLGGVRERIGEREGVRPISIRWRWLEEGRIFLFDSAARTIWLNDGYRAALGGVTREAPLLKTLIYLLLQDRFTNQHIRQVTKDEIEAWQSVLASALIDQVGANSYAAPLTTDDDAPALLLGGLDGNVHPTSQSLDVVPISADNARQDSPNAAPAGESSMAVRRSEAFASDPATVVMVYKREATIAGTAERTGVDSREVARVLCLHVLGLEEPLDDESLYPRHGLMYTPEERERIVIAYRSGTAVPRIAHDIGRTPLAIGWQLFDHPSRPVVIKRSLIRRLRRRATHCAGDD